ncbi:MAG TPA: hypothetical protein VLD58_05825, partial [Gemmatimonadales bacterium]|nr:hypothetical protein [Gemmatimonadales bacterium]
MIHPLLEGRPTAAERWAFDLLVDLSRLLHAVPEDASAVQVSLVESLPAGDFLAEQGRVRLSRGLLRRVLDIGGAAVEQRTTERDHHGRVPASANPQVQSHAERSL